VERSVKGWASGIVASGLLVLGARAAAIDVPGTNGTVRATGWVEGRAIVDTGGGPEQRPGARAEVALSGAPAPGLRARLAVRGWLGGPFEGASAGIFDLGHTWQNYSPNAELAEAYLDYRRGRATVTAGIQKIAWGRLDGLPPSDVVIPRDYHDPIVEDFEQAKIGVPMLKAVYDLPDVRDLELSNLRASLIWVPWAVPPRLPLPDERWFPETIGIGPNVILPRHALESRFADVLGIDVRFAHDVVVPVRNQPLNDHPPRTLGAGGIGGQIKGRARRIDWTLSHYSGPENGPNLTLHPRLRLLDLGLQPDGTLAPSLRAVAVLEQAHSTTHMTALDGGFTLGDAAVRAEFAIFQNRQFLRIAHDLVSPSALRELPLQPAKIRKLLSGQPVAVPLGNLFVGRNAVEWGIGVDYPVAGFMPILQLQQTALLEPAPRLVIDNPETRVIGIVRRNVWADRVQGEVRAVYEFSRGGWFVMPRVSYAIRDNFTFTVGYLAIGGTRNSYIGQFQHNDEVLFQTRVTF
jgi:hypothetical protein